MRKKYTTSRLLGMAAAALFVAAPAWAQDGDQPLLDSDPVNDGQQVEIGETGEIELHVQDLEITTVLQLLSLQSERNIIAARGVEGTSISADLYGVDFYEALNSILEPNGFGYIEEGAFIYVMPIEDIRAREDANRVVTTRIYRLDYLRADEAALFVTPMLSENGTITASGNVEDGIDPGIDNAGSNSFSGMPTLVIRDYEDTVEEIATVLDELDTRPKQVIIETTVLRASLTEDNQLGIDFSLFSDLTGSGPLDVVDDLITAGQPGPDRTINGQAVLGDVASQTGGMKLGFVAGDASVFVSALDQVTDTTLIATPNVTVLDRQRTSILVGEKIAYLSTTVTETSETQTVEFLEVGTQLNVRPFVASDGSVRLELRPSVSDATIRTIGSTSVPDETTVELVTNVIVESGQTIVLGGLITDDTSVTRSQVPWLGDVPLFGAAFAGQDDTISRSEVIFLVKATVIENGQLDAVTRAAQDRIAVARVAEREQLLAWSRTRMTAGHMQNAQLAYDQAMALEEGSQEREDLLADALMSVDMALHMDPSMVGALRLKEQITGTASYITYEESIVTQSYDVLDAEIEELDLPEAVEEEAAQEQPAEELAQDAQAEEDAETPADLEEAWFDEFLADEFSDAGEQPAEHPAEELTEAEQAVVEEADQQAAADEQKPQNEEEADWQELSTAELLQLAAEAAGQTQAEDEQASDEETDNSSADVETETD